MVFCPKCGKQNQDEAIYCKYCGNALPKPYAGNPQPVSSYTSQPYVPTTPQAAPKKSHTGRNVAIGIAVIVVVIVIVAVIIGSGFIITSSSSGPSGSGFSGQMQQNVPVSTGSVAVNANGYTYVSFTVPQGASNIALQGSFMASGGSGNDIKVYVMDSTNYINWENGHGTNMYYNSGQVTTDNLNVALPSSGTYYLVFDNQFSLITAKTVSTNINLTYYS